MTRLAEKLTSDNRKLRNRNYLQMRNTKIILVDDSEIFRKAICTLLTKIGNNQIIAEASNGKEFLDKLRKAEEDGIDFEVIRKPVDSEQLTHIVKGILDKPRIY